MCGVHDFAGDVVEVCGGEGVDLCESLLEGYDVAGVEVVFCHAECGVLEVVGSNAELPLELAFGGGESAGGEGGVDESVELAVDESEAAADIPELAYLAWPCLGLFWVGLAIVAAALAFAWRIFAEIGRDNSFCAENARRLRIISGLALTDTLLCAAGIVALFLLRALHPGVFLLLLLITAVGAGITVAAAALSHLTLKAAVLQDENDLTV